MKKILVRLFAICSLFGLLGCVVDLSDPNNLLTSKISEAEICVNAGEQAGYVYTIPKKEISDFVSVLLEKERHFEALEEAPDVTDSLFQVTFCDSSKKKLGEIQVINAELIRVENKYYKVEPAFENSLLEVCLDAKSH